MWKVIIIIILAALLVACVTIKLLLRRKLKDIDGFNGVRKQKNTDEEEGVIGHFGDDE